jgi:hypothetical protein
MAQPRYFTQVYPFLIIGAVISTENIISLIKTRLKKIPFSES